ncbi:MAG: hypothetical protein ACLRLX_05455 [Anaerovoracaceae bacterium]
MENSDILVKSSKIRKSAKVFYSNIYSSDLGSILDIKEGVNTLAVLTQDRDVKRGYFSSGSLEELTDIIKEWPKATGIDFISKVDIDSVSKAFNNAGFNEYAVYVKAENNRIKEFLSEMDTKEYDYELCEEFLSDINTEDAYEVHKFLYSAFNPLTSHIESEEELKKRILKNNIAVHKENGKIVTVLTFNPKQKALYMEHMLNKGQSQYMHMLYYKVLKDAADRGVIKVDTWIRETNSRAFNFVKRYGLEPSSMKNFVFCN